MTRKHVKAIADSLYMTMATPLQIRHMAHILAEFSPNFNKEHFIKAATNAEATGEIK